MYIYIYIYLAVRKEISRRIGKIHEELYNRCASPDFIRVFKRTRLRWEGNSVHMGTMRGE
jgi:hypothetical protein